MPLNITILGMYATSIRTYNQNSRSGLVAYSPIGGDISGIGRNITLD